MDKDDGGPAFPMDGIHDFWPGMSLRKYFAAKAMQSIILNGTPGMIEKKWIADMAYEIADAMIEAGKS